MPGNFTCAELQTVNVEVDRIWADTLQAQNYRSKVEVLTAIRAEQTAALEILENPEKDRELKVYWAQDCNETLEDCTNRCVIGGDEADAGCKSYALDMCKTTGFSIRENIFRTSNLTREQVVAKSLARRLKLLDEWLAKQMVAKIDAWAGANQFLDGEGDPDNDNVTYIAPSYWNADIYGYFAQVAMMNDFSDVFMLHGGNLYRQYRKAKYASLNPDQKDAIAEFDSIRSYWDMWNIDGVLAPEKTSFMIQKGAIAFANKAYYPLNNPVEYFDDTRWSIESKALPGVYYDVYYNNECVSNGDVKHNWSIYVTAGMFLNPFGCNEDITGVIKFVCGENAGS